jgi:hypothetical protein
VEGRKPLHFKIILLVDPVFLCFFGEIDKVSEGNQTAGWRIKSQSVSISIFSYPFDHFWDPFAVI